MTVDETMPEGPWEFDEAVTDAFDDMLGRSIPEYRAMRALVSDLAVRILQPGDLLMDLGCSRGEALREVIEHPRCPPGVRAVGLEVSPPMLAAATERFEANRQVEICEWDLRQGVPFMHGNAGVVLGVLTIMFTPMQWRPHLLADVRRVLRPGGAFLFVEKVLGQTADVDRLITDAYHDLKAANGYTREQIDRKALALEGVQVPVTAAWNEDLLRSAGFTSVDCIWRWGPFAGWLAQ